MISAIDFRAMVVRNATKTDWLWELNAQMKESGGMQVLWGLGMDVIEPDQTL
jgi:hypothetical protein